MSADYQVKTIRFESGERLPLLLSKETGMPVWDVTLFILTELRATSLAENTIALAARAVMVGLQIFRYLGIDLNQRLEQGKLLSLSEVDELVKLAGLKQEEIDALLGDDIRSRVRPRASSLEKARMRVSANVSKQVGSGTKTTRLLYIRNYIEWLTASRRLKLDVGHMHYAALDGAAQAMMSQLSARIPSGDSDSGSRQGVSAEVRARILEVINPDSSENPWKNKHVRLRNQLIFMWLLLLGMRNGELLSVYVSDVNLRAGEVVIVRRPGNPVEERGDAPLVKTRGRLLVLSPELMSLTRDYIIGQSKDKKGSRSNIKGARRHPYLFVATGSGAALSKSALNKLFRELRTKVPGLTNDLSPHVLRHTWNDDFSELMDTKGVSSEDEERMRRQAMGWSPQSRMSARYTKRHIQRKSNEASLAMQAKSFQAPNKKI